jgi:hypothetical protein
LGPALVRRRRKHPSMVVDDGAELIDPDLVLM